MRACPYNVLLVNQISCSRGEERVREESKQALRFVYIASHLFKTHLCDARAFACVYVCMYIYVHGPTQEKNRAQSNIKNELYAV